MIAETDASLKDGYSTHSFWLKDWKGKTLFEKRFNGIETKSTEAELHTIIKLLQFINEREMVKVRIYTDCKHIVDATTNINKGKIDVTYLKHLLKITNSKLIWTPRDNNKRCDENCKLSKYEFKKRKGLI